MQNKAARWVCNKWKRDDSVSEMRTSIGWETLQERRAKARLCMLQKIQYSLIAIPITLLPAKRIKINPKGPSEQYHAPRTRTLSYRNTFMLAAPSLWNGLPHGVLMTLDPEVFRASLPAVCFKA